MLTNEFRTASECLPPYMECVEVGEGGGMVFVRDSKSSNSPVLSFSADEWNTFIKGVKAGEFDLPLNK